MLMYRFHHPRFHYAIRMRLVNIDILSRLFVFKSHPRTGRRTFIMFIISKGRKQFYSFFISEVFRKFTKKGLSAFLLYPCRFVLSANVTKFSYKTK